MKETVRQFMGEHMARVVRAVALLTLLAPDTVLGAVQYDRILMPLAVRNLQGSHGSVWTVSAWVANLSSETKDFQTDEQCFAILCPPFALAGGAARPIAFKDQPPDNPGLVVYFESPGTAGTIQLLAKDLSRQALTAGTEIPIARESQFRSDRLRFLRVPVEARFRQMLRIYALDAPDGASVRIRFLDELRREIVSTQLTLTLPAPAAGFVFKPAYAELGNLSSAFPVLGSYRELIIDVEPSTPNLKIWGFVSVTHDETQHTTVISMP